MARNKELMQVVELVAEVEEEVTWVASNSYFITIVFLSNTESTIGFVELANVYCSWNLESFDMAMD
jgi:hypothetical protein